MFLQTPRRFAVRRASLKLTSRVTTVVHEQMYFFSGDMRKYLKPWNLAANSIGESEG